jgi:ABC-type nitrate/sulfonate/bicarbonate transport system substrate-binding protein
MTLSALRQRLPGAASGRTIRPCGPSGPARAHSSNGQSMNTANLQLEGLYVVLSALLVAMRDKGLFDDREIDRLLAETEATLAADPGRPAEMRDANVDAISFPVRFLREALLASSEGGGHSFAELAARVGQRKRAP